MFEGAVFEATVVMVVNNNDNEPPRTKVFRIEFDSERAMDRWLRSGTHGVDIDDDHCVLSSEDMTALVK